MHKVTSFQGRIDARGRDAEGYDTRESHAGVSDNRDGTNIGKSKIGKFSSILSSRNQLHL